MPILLVVLLFTSCTHMNKQSTSGLEFFDFAGRPEGRVSVEAFSGLFFDHKTAAGEWVFWTHTDRGPNADPIGDKRPFIDPAFQPRLTQFKVKSGEKRAHYLKEIPLFLPDGRRMSGLPNFPPMHDRSGDETPVGLDGTALPFDPMGIDPEGICLIGEHFWLVEEYGPSLLKFDLAGKLITRFVPQGYWRSAPLPYYVKEVLPAELMKRKMNRGFEGIACDGERLWAAMQSPLPQEGVKIHIIEFNTQTEKMVQSFYYPLDSLAADKIGDLSFHNGKLFVLEQNSQTGPASIHRVYSVDLKDAAPGAILNKTLALDLVKAGFDFAEKVEGIALIDASHLAVINDNDFGLAGSIDHRHNPVMAPTRISRLAIIKLD